MRFSSTRNREYSFNLVDAVTRGLAPDGGLFLPDIIPADFVANASGQTFPEYSASILAPFLADTFTGEEIREICSETFTFDVPVVKLEGAHWAGVSVLELFHGPTHSFKDFGARFLGQLLKQFNDPDSNSTTGSGTIISGPNGSSGGNKTVVLVATSGDTGSAVAAGLSGIPGVEVVILYPSGQVSEFQERQLTRVRDGVTACKVNGTFDDCQKLVKASFSEPVLRDVTFTSANSINIGRLLPQMTYYAWASHQMDSSPIFCVPSGNLGNLTAGMLAYLGGMQAKGFIAGHNSNRFFPEFLSTGDTRSRESIRTVSNAMDVGAPSNFERLQTLFPESDLGKLVTGESVSDEDTLKTIQQVFDETGYVADPHTGVGLRSAERYRSTHRNEQVIVLSTAHPAKFDSFLEAPTQIDLLSDVEMRSIEIDNELKVLAEIVLSVAATS